MGLGTLNENELYSEKAGPLEDTVKRTITLVDMACPTEVNKDVKQEEKTLKYQQLCFELRKYGESDSDSYQMSRRRTERTES